MNMVYYRFTMRSRGTQEYQKKIMVSFFSLENTYSNGINAYFNLAGINVWNFGQHSVEKSDQLCDGTFPGKIVLNDWSKLLFHTRQCSILRNSASKPWLHLLRKKKLKNLTTANFIVDYDMACQRALFLGLFRDRSLFIAWGGWDLEEFGFVTIKLPGLLVV